jgi:hypothetical protein
MSKRWIFKIHAKVFRQSKQTQKIEGKTYNITMEVVASTIDDAMIDAENQAMLLFNYSNKYENPKILITQIDLL